MKEDAVREANTLIAAKIVQAESSFQQLNEYADLWDARSHQLDEVCLNKGLGNNVLGTVRT